MSEEFAYQDKDQVEFPLGYPFNGIEKIMVNRPKVKDLRGLQLDKIYALDVDTMVKLIPRITILTDHDLEQLHPADFIDLCDLISGFFLSIQRMKKAAKLAEAQEKIQ